ncbi:arylamine N-acetyltransferase, pineal gland isozyme NAT-10 [Anolis carolinensis]|uniref:arylamine N-acetyltransferase n=1 Tax=Anolis carolinensis TaxID=28377 RepID=H9GHM4_ANOCA|nr:PREDICTED: arylamine N-acetyltransferase, pineal gland isozyme NAT-10-like [Anolis carolinensis]|eukprot:XP_003228570.1 PREDICTED: arylamine N-acetyltransferase, pineal gland isozyme NAT-10-like [Anolis carolinensis]
MNVEEYFARTSYKGSLEKLDLETLTDIFQHHIRAVPFENLSVHCGETITLDLEDVYEKIVRKRRGGWCMENNQLLLWVLQTLGFDTTPLGSYVYNPQQGNYRTDMSHLIMKVVIDGTTYIVDGGYGSTYQMWEPMELVSGKDQPQTPGIFRFTEEKGTWYLEKVRRKQHVPDPDFSHLVGKVGRREIYYFNLKPVTMEDFQPQCLNLQTSPNSLFTRKSICTLQTAVGFRALVGWTFSETTYGYEEDTDLVEFKALRDEEVEPTLREEFGISLERKLVPINLPGNYDV